MELEYINKVIGAARKSKSYYIKNFHYSEVRNEAISNPNIILPIYLIGELSNEELDNYLRIKNVALRALLFEAIEYGYIDLIKNLLTKVHLHQVDWIPIIDRLRINIAPIIITLNQVIPFPYSLLGNVINIGDIESISALIELANPGDPIIYRNLIDYGQLIILRTESKELIDKFITKFRANDVDKSIYLKSTIATENIELIRNLIENHNIIVERGHLMSTNNLDILRYLANKAEFDGEPIINSILLKVAISRRDYRQIEKLLVDNPDLATISILRDRIDSGDEKFLEIYLKVRPISQWMEIEIINRQQYHLMKYITFNEDVLNSITHFNQPLIEILVPVFGERVIIRLIELNHKDLISQYYHLLPVNTDAMVAAVNRGLPMVKLLVRLGAPIDVRAVNSAIYDDKIFNYLINIGAPVDGTTIANLVFNNKCGLAVSLIHQGVNYNYSDIEMVRKYDRDLADYME